MTKLRIAASVLAVILLVLLVWSWFADVGDVRTRAMLVFGVGLGLLYAVLGRVPDWIVDSAGGSITADDDPGNISPRVYLPILLVAILIAVMSFVYVVFFG